MDNRIPWYMRLIIFIGIIWLIVSSFNGGVSGNDKLEFDKKIREHVE